MTDSTQEAYRRGYRDGYRDAREDRGVVVPDQDQEIACPDCGEAMKIRRGKHGVFYGCIDYPACKGTASCDKDGNLKGIPANAETRAARTEAHKCFDQLWKSKLFKSRAAAYRWLQEAMGLSKDDAHIGKFDQHQCARAARLARDKLRGPRIVKF